MSGSEFAGDILDTVALVREEDDEVVEDVGALVDEVLVIARYGTDDALYGFLTEFFGDLVGAFTEETCGVAAVGHLSMALVDEILKLLEEHDIIGLVGLAPAGVCTGVADRAVGVNLDEESIVVAVFRHGDDVEEVAACLAFCPKGLAATAEERDDAIGFSFFEGFLIHVAEHEDFACIIVLDDCGDESCGVFCEIHCRGCGVW